MKKYQVRERGTITWTPWDYSGYDHYDAAENYASDHDEEGSLTTGEQAVIELREIGQHEIKTVVIYAEVQVKYNSRDFKDGE